jgi:hypothetical protein
MVECQHGSFSFDDDPCPEDVNHRQEHHHCFAECNGSSKLSLFCSHVDRESLGTRTFVWPGEEQLLLLLRQHLLYVPSQQALQLSAQPALKRTL